MPDGTLGIESCPHCGRSDAVPGLSPRRAAALARIRGALAALEQHISPDPGPRLTLIHKGGQDA